MPKDQPIIRWAPKIRQDHIRRLYEMDARSIRNAELLAEVGCGLYARCLAILEVSNAVKGNIKCKSCGAKIEHLGRKNDVILCGSCGWEVDWHTYHKSYQCKQLFGGAALPIFEEYVRVFPTVRGPREQMLLIDRLIHEFHWNITRRDPTPRAMRPTAANLIEGDSLAEVIAFLDKLAGFR